MWILKIIYLLTILSNCFLDLIGESITRHYREWKTDGTLEDLRPHEAFLTNN